MSSKGVVFNSELFSDIRIRISLSPDVRAGAKRLRDSEADGPIYFAHRSVLASSPTLKTLMQRVGDEEEERQQKELEAIQNSNSSMEMKLQAMKSLLQTNNKDPERGCLDLPMEADELLATEVLLRFLYSGDFPGEVEQGLGGPSSRQHQAPSKCKLLLQLYRLADRFEVQAALDACAVAMSEISEQDWGELDNINCIFSLNSTAPALWEHDPIQALRARCVGQLVARLNADWDISPLDHLWKNVFPNLVFSAMHALARSDTLWLSSENDVVALLNCWVINNHPSTQELVQLSHAVRLWHLTPSYLGFLKQIAPWFQAEQDELINVMVVARCPCSIQSSYLWSPASWYASPHRKQKARSSSFGLHFPGDDMAYVFDRALGVGVGSCLECDDVEKALCWPRKGYQVSYYLVLERPADDETFILLKVAVTVSPWTGSACLPENYRGWHVPMQCDLKVTSDLGSSWSVVSDNNAKPVIAGKPWLCSTYIKIPLEDVVVLLGQELSFKAKFNIF